MEKYIREELEFVEIVRGRGAQKFEKVTEREKKALISIVCQLNWLGKEGCPTVAGTAYMLASRVEQGTVAVIFVANAAVRSLKELCTMILRLWKFNSIEDIMPVSFGDCAGPGSASGGSPRSTCSLFGQAQNCDW